MNTRKMIGLFLSMMLVFVAAPRASAERTLFGMALGAENDQARALNALATSDGRTFETENLIYTLTAYAFDGSLLAAQMLVTPKDGAEMLISDYANEIDDPCPIDGVYDEENMESFAARSRRLGKSLRFGAILNYENKDGNPPSFSGTYCESFNADGSMYLFMEERLCEPVEDSLTLMLRFYDFQPGEGRKYALIPVDFAVNVGPCRVIDFAIDERAEYTRFDRLTLTLSPLSCQAVLSGRVEKGLSQAQYDSWRQWFMETADGTSSGWYALDAEGGYKDVNTFSGGERRECVFDYGLGENDLHEIQFISQYTRETFTVRVDD